MADKILDIDVAKLDLSRPDRTGQPESVFAQGKTPEQLLAILKAFQKRKCAVLATRCSKEQVDYLKKHRLKDFVYHEQARVLTLGKNRDYPHCHTVAICTGGTADIPVAEEAAVTAEFFGANVTRHYDIGVAGIHRLFASLPKIREARAVIAVAGMEGALASVLAGLVSVPVIAVPTSVGYGASFQGLTPLLSMLNSCAEGVSVVNIDNGFGAASLVCRMFRTFPALY
ncbi:MAG: nickel pincer cofactor biosynthesis protein LarB [Akkermansia sp.]|nr:nickel pincer cofactor biosynthesis protein LarB [Akkermansia sp.]